MEKMKIEIWSDIACPHCYIGLRRLQKALDKFSHGDSVELIWHSYELSPSIPKEYNGVRYSDFFSEIMQATQQEVQNYLTKVTSMAKEEELNYDYEKAIPANTHNALRLVKLAATIGKATEMEETLFDAYFAKGKDVSSRSVLIDLGKKVGLEHESIEKMLDSDKYEIAVQKDIEFSEQTLNLESVPFYLLNNKTLIQGSIPSDDYLKALTEAYADWEKNGVGTDIGGTISGKACSIDGICS